MPSTQTKVPRWGIAAGVLLIFDQLTKTLAQLTLQDRSLEPVDGWGLTYVVNPGTWLWPDAGMVGLVALQGIGVVVWAGWLWAMAWYRTHYRWTSALEWATGFLTLAVFGNAIDRVLVDGARDWVITPIAIGNFADVAVWPAIALVVAELVQHPPSRRLLSLDPRRWTPD